MPDEEADSDIHALFHLSVVQLTADALSSTTDPDLGGACATLCEDALPVGYASRPAFARASSNAFSTSLPRSAPNVSVPSAALVTP